MTKLAPFALPVSILVIWTLWMWPHPWSSLGTCVPSLALSFVWAALGARLLLQSHGRLEPIGVAVLGIVAPMPYVAALWRHRHWYSDADGEPNLIWVIGGPAWLAALCLFTVLLSANTLEWWRRRGR